MSDALVPSNVQDSVREFANTRLLAIEEMLKADGLAIISPIVESVEHRTRIAVEGRENRRDTLFVILDTSGGIVEVVERIVRILRRHYTEVKFIIPNRAMSAGTVLAMSGDAILMDYHSCLGPIDPQLQRAGSLVPALSYLSQYEELKRKSESGALSTAELVLLQKLDLAELHRFELARDLSISLLKEWLTRYKFKDWTVTETSRATVSTEMKEKRAEDIARKLNDHTRWLTHGRGIDMATLEGELKLKIDDLDGYPGLKVAAWDYFWFTNSYMQASGTSSFVHTPNFF